jgi:hypothetical protein
LFCAEPERPSPCLPNSLIKPSQVDVQCIVDTLQPLVYEAIGMMHSQKFVELVAKKREELLTHPWRQTSSVIEGAGASWLAK